MTKTQQEAARADHAVLGVIRANGGTTCPSYLVSATGYTHRYITRQVAPRLEAAGKIRREWRKSFATGRGRWVYAAKETR